MTGVVINLPYIKILDINGYPVSGAECYFYYANTTTPMPAYTDPAMGTQHPSPLLTDAAGDLPLVFLDPDEGSYALRVVYDDVDQTYNELAPGVSVPVSIAQGGTGSTTAPDALIALGAASQASVDNNSALIAANTQDIALPKKWSERQIPYASVITPDYSLDMVNAVASVQGDMLVNVPTGLVEGQSGRLNLIMDNSGDHTITFGTDWGFGDAPELNTQPWAKNVIEFYVRWVDGADPKLVSWMETKGGAGSTASPDVMLKQEENSGVSGGSRTAGSWRTRNLNSTKYNSGPLVGLSNGQFTLEPGTYFLQAQSIVYDAGSAQCRLQNTTSNTTLDHGLVVDTADANSNAATTVAVTSRFTLDVASELALQERVSNTKTEGGGNPAGFGTEVYANVEIWKV